jgi:ClpP class serine protease
MYAARKRKKVVALVNPLATSAAYWIASQASEIVAVGKSAEVGAVGVFLVHFDVSRSLDAAGITPTVISNSQSPHKTELSPYAPLSDEAKAHEQSEVDALGRQFISAVTRGRGISAVDVQAKFGQGRVLRAPHALSAGMIDRIGDIESVIKAGGVSADAMARRRRLELAKAR